MKKNKIHFIFIFSVINYLSIFSVEGVNRKTSTHFHSYPSKLNKIVKTIYQFPKAKDLITKASVEGPIKIRIESGGMGCACWDSISRTIYLNSHQNRTEGDYISGIIFELHNSIASYELEGLTNKAIDGVISKDEYVVGIEKIEHSNSLKASKLLAEGIQKNYFPKSAEWEVYEDFDEHFKIQKANGHSQRIEQSYNHMHS